MRTSVLQRSAVTVGAVALAVARGGFGRARRTAEVDSGHGSVGGNRRGGGRPASRRVARHRGRRVRRLRRRPARSTVFDLRLLLRPDFSSFGWATETFDGTLRGRRGKLFMLETASSGADGSTRIDVIVVGGTGELGSVRGSLSFVYRCAFPRPAAERTRARCSVSAQVVQPAVAPVSRVSAGCRNGSAPSPVRVGLVRLSLYEFATGVATIGGERVVYDIANDVAHYGAATASAHALVWQVDDTEEAEEALVSRRIQLDPFASLDRAVRPDRLPAGRDRLYPHTSGTGNPLPPPRQPRRCRPRAERRSYWTGWRMVRAGSGRRPGNGVNSTFRRRSFAC